MRMNLKVPFAEKDEAKKLGARWDAARKLWYIDNDGKLAAFARWSPTPHAADDGTVLAGPAAKPRQSAGKLVIGSAYREVLPLCACPPWQLCTQCRPLALAS
ncbi:MAG: DUF5710 domain-containing protein [Azonexus sp.]|nr:DUF5710 domain-containing protein [Azonexus sp.]